MITYKNLWTYMEEHQVSQYKLVASGISHSTLARLKRNQSVSVYTIDKLCNILGCGINDIMEHIPDKRSNKSK